MPVPTRKRIGEILLAQGAIHEGELNEALARQEELSLRQKLGSVLVLMGVVDEQTVAQAVAEQLGLPCVDPLEATVDPALVWRIPRRVAEQHLVLALDRPMAGGRADPSAVRVAMAEPSDLDRVSELEFLLGGHVEPEVASTAALRQAIARHYDTTGLPGRALVEVPRDMRPPVTSPTGRELDERAILTTLASGDAGAGYRAALDHVLVNATERGATEVRFEPDSDGLRVRYLLDGAARTALQLPAWAAAPMISRVKMFSGLAVFDTRAAQIGDATLSVGAQHIALRVSTQPDERGETATIEWKDADTPAYDLGGLGMDPATLATLDTLLSADRGLMLVTGPRSSGRDTTIRTLANRLGERAFVVAGNIHDQAGAAGALGAASSGLVLATVDAPGAAAAADRLASLCGADAGTALLGVLNQRLLRRVCRTCSRPTKTTAHDWLRLGVSPVDLGPDARRRGPGCPRCAYSGSQGRVAVFALTTAAGLAGEDPPDARTLLEQALDAVARGQTTLEEVARKVPAGRSRPTGDAFVSGAEPHPSRSTSPPPPSSLPFHVPPSWTPPDEGS